MGCRRGRALLVGDKSSLSSGDGVRNNEVTERVWRGSSGGAKAEGRFEEDGRARMQDWQRG